MKLKKLKLAIELVPSTAWQKSLYRQMPRKTWKKLREELISNSGGKCEICASTGKLFCHEVWHYNNKLHVQRLAGFKIICNMCNFVKHIGLAQNLALENRLDFGEVVKHFLRVNRVKRAVFQVHKKRVFDVWRKRSEFKWKVDLGKFEHMMTGNGAYPAALRRWHY